MGKHCIPRPDCVRRIERSFAWIDHRLLRNGYMAVMTNSEQGLYLFLVLAADRNGVSFYRKEKICDLLGLDFGEFEVARDRLIDLKLIAFEPYCAGSPNGHYQVLPVVGSAPDFTAQVVRQLAGQPAAKPEPDAGGQPASLKEILSSVPWARSQPGRAPTAR